MRTKRLPRAAAREKEATRKSTSPVWGNVHTRHVDDPFEEGDPRVELEKRDLGEHPLRRRGGGKAGVARGWRR
jgi:hypothetical protein